MIRSLQQKKDFLKPTSLWGDSDFSSNISRNGFTASFLKHFKLWDKTPIFKNSRFRRLLKLFLKFFCYQKACCLNFHLMEIFLDKVENWSLRAEINAAHFFAAKTVVQCVSCSQLKNNWKLRKTSKTQSAHNIDQPHSNFPVYP